MEHGVKDTATTMRSPWRIVVAIVAALCACLTCLIVGAWLVLRMSGAREEFTSILNRGVRLDALSSADLLERLYVPVMLGVQGCSAIVSGLCVGLIAGRKSAGAAIVGIAPLYLITFATGLTTENVIWVCAYAASAIAAAYVIGRKR